MNLKEQRFYIYGAGIFGNEIIKECLSKHLKIEAIIDEYSQLSTIKNIPVLKLSSSELKLELPVITSVLGYPEVEDNLLQSGFNKIINTEAAFELFPIALKSLTTCGFMWMQKDNEINQERISQFRKLLSGEHSKLTLDKLINFRLKPSRQNYPWPESYEMYFPRDLTSRLYNQDTIDYIDCGAFDGDSLASLIKYYNGEISSYNAIDISSLNLELLNSRLNKITRKIDSINIFQVALSTADGGYVDVVESGSATCAQKSKDNDYSKVPIKSLDSIIKDVKHPFLKMDIEGEDFNALQGAKNLIQNYKPNMSLSVYHNPKDLWEIGLLINSLVPNTYSFYLRQEGHWGLETILYAIAN